jgi:hypothetical protein
MDSNGCTSAFLEQRLNMGFKFILSAEVNNLLVYADAFFFCNSTWVYIFWSILLI